MIPALITRLAGAKVGGYATIVAMTFVASVIAGAYWKGWSDRGVREALRIERINAARMEDAARIAAQAAELERVIAERNLLAEELENAALADMDAGRPGIGVDGVRRLNQR